MAIYELNSEISLPRPLEEVFPFFADAFNLQQLTPGSLHFKVLTPAPIEMKVGALIDYQLRLFGLPVRWQSEITAWEPPYRFVDEQTRGPYKLWQHEHRFEFKDGKTLVQDYVRYENRGGALINRLFVRPNLNQIFEYRREKLKELFG